MRQRRGADLRVAKQRLAWEVTALVHGRAAADTALETSRSLFGDEAGTHEAAPTTEVPAAEVATGIPVLDLLVRTHLADSKRRARTLIGQRGVRLNGENLPAAGEGAGGEARSRSELMEVWGQGEPRSLSDTASVVG